MVELWKGNDPDPCFAYERDLMFVHQLRESYLGHPADPFPLDLERALSGILLAKTMYFMFQRLEEEMDDAYRITSPQLYLAQ